MADRAPDPTPTEITEMCRQFRLQWNEEEREEAMSDATQAGRTDAADSIYIDGLYQGFELSFEECLAEVGDEEFAPVTAARRSELPNGADV